MNDRLLRYKISDLHQLSRCMSNSSRDLSIRVSDFLNDERLSGVRVTVYHSTFGDLFTYVFDAQGTLIFDEGTGELLSPEMTYDQLFDEIEKFGFLVEYESKNALGVDQIQYLMEIQNLHFDKLRIISIKEKGKRILVAFNASTNAAWLNNAYQPTETELNNALRKGTAINLSEISNTRNYDWSWLDFVANISDIIENNPDAASKLKNLHWKQV